MTEKLPINDVKEAIVAANEISLFMVSRFKDGVQAGDFLAFWTKFQSDEEFKAIVKAGFDGYKNIKAQLLDTDIREGVELAKVQLDYLPKLVDALKESVSAPAEDVFSAPTA